MEGERRENAREMEVAQADIGSWRLLATAWKVKHFFKVQWYITADVLQITPTASGFTRSDTDSLDEKTNSNSSTHKRGLLAAKLATDRQKPPRWVTLQK